MLIRLVALAVVALGLSPAAASVRAVRPVAAASSVRPVVLPVVPFALDLAPSAGIRAALTPTLRAPNDAPKSASQLRAEAADAVAQWRASRAPATAVAAAAPVAAVNVAPLTPAEAIATAQTSGQALSRLVELGVIKPQDIPEGETDRVALLKRVWDGVSAKLTSDVLPVDASWAVPAITVKRDGKTYLVHGVAHGELYPPNRRQVARLVAQIEKNGHALLSEQNLPAHYGFAYGQETMDQAVDRHGVPARVTDAAGGPASGGIAAVHAVLRWAALGGTGYAWLRAALSPTDPLVWALAVGVSLGLWLLARGLQPLNRLALLSAARDAERLGSKDLAAHLRREARAFFGPRGVKAEDILRLHLPPGPGAASDSLSPRSSAIAGAALAASASVVHVLVGYRHAAEIAWRLAGADAAVGTAARATGASERNGGSVTKPLFFGVLGAVALAFGLAQMNTGYMLAGGFWLGSALWDYLNKDKPAEAMTARALLGYPPHVYLLMAAAFVTAVVAPVAAPLAMLGLAAWSALTSKTAREYFDASQALFTLSIGLGFGALLAYGLHGFDIGFIAAGVSAVLANIIGKLMKFAAIRKS